MVQMYTVLYTFSRNKGTLRVCAMVHFWAALLVFGLHYQKVQNFTDFFNYKRTHIICLYNTSSWFSRPRSYFVNNATSSQPHTQTMFPSSFPPISRKIIELPTKHQQMKILVICNFIIFLLDCYNVDRTNSCAATISKSKLPIWKRIWKKNLCFSI